jgi:hypothetical protein
MFLRRQGEARRSIPSNRLGEYKARQGDQPPSSRLGEYKARQGNTISVKNERKHGKVKGKKDKARIGKAARTPRRRLKNIASMYIFSYEFSKQCSALNSL